MSDSKKVPSDLKTSSTPDGVPGVNYCGDPAVSGYLFGVGESNAKTMGRLGKLRPPVNGYACSLCFGDGVLLELVRLSHPCRNKPGSGLGLLATASRLVSCVSCAGCGYDVALVSESQRQGELPAGCLEDLQARFPRRT